MVSYLQLKLICASFYKSHPIQLESFVSPNKHLTHSWLSQKPPCCYCYCCLLGRFWHSIPYIHVSYVTPYLLLELRKPSRPDDVSKSASGAGYTMLIVILRDSSIHIIWEAIGRHLYAVFLFSQDVHSADSWELLMIFSQYARRRK